MPRNGSGTYTLPAGNPVVTGTTISSTVQNNTTSDIATALTNSIAKDGQTIPTANLPMGGFKHTGVADATQAGEYAVYGQNLGSFGTTTFTGDVTMSSATDKWSKGADVASASALPVLSDGNYFDVTGTTTITSINTIGVGTWIRLHFDDALILTHNATDLVLPTGANITTAAGDEAEFIEYATGDWRCVSYQRANGNPVVSQSGKLYDLDATVAGNDLTITVNAGTWDFRSTTLTDGTPVTRTLSSPASVVVPNGATLGTVNATEAMLAVLLIDNAGTLEATVVNISGGINIDERGLITTTTIGTGSDSALVPYSTTGRTNVAYRVIGYITITEATAGTWASAPTTVVSAGSLSANAINFNARGAAPMFACRAWVNWNGIGVVAIRASGNVSSITDNGLGAWRVNFTTAMPDADYSASFVGSQEFGVSNVHFEINTTAANAESAPSVNYMDMIAITSAGTYKDIKYLNAAFFR